MTKKQNRKPFLGEALWGKWQVARTIWPYPEGYGVYREQFFTGKRTILDTGLPKEQATAIAEQLNSES